MLANACFLRLSARRLFSSGPTSIVSSSSSGSKTTSRVLAVWKEATARERPRVSWKQYFDSDYFWNEANVGPFFLFLFSVPYLYGGLKTVYSTFKYRRLNEQEIISDRLTWLHERFLEDEVESVLLQQVPADGFDRSRPGLLLGPSIV